MFDKGRKVVETVTGKPSEASTPEDLEEEVKNLPQDQQAVWAQQMQHELALYQAETDRIELEGGRVDHHVTSKITSGAADKIAVLRQSTRPWAVRMAMYFILLPVFLALVDVAQGLLAHWIVHPIGAIFDSAGMQEFAGFEAFKTVFGVGATDAVTKEEGLSSTVVGLIYTESVVWLTGIVVAYMGLREYGKSRRTSGDEGALPIAAATPITTIGRTLVQAGGVADQISKVVDRVREAAKKF